MRREWSPEDLIACWTLVGDDWARVGQQDEATRLGFALLLKDSELDARFPRHAAEVPAAAIDYMAEQVKVDPQLFAQYDWSEAVDQGTPRPGPHSARVPRADDRAGRAEPRGVRWTRRGGRGGAGRSYSGVTVRRKRQPDTTSR